MARSCQDTQNSEEAAHKHTFVTGGPALGSSALFGDPGLINGPRTKPGLKPLWFSTSCGKCLLKADWLRLIMVVKELGAEMFLEAPFFIPTPLSSNQVHYQALFSTGIAQ